MSDVSELNAVGFQGRTYGSGQTGSDIQSGTQEPEP